MAIGYREAFNQGAYSHALDEGSNERSSGKAGIPDPTQTLGLVTVFERHTAQDQPGEHQQQRQVEGREECGIDNRKGAPEDHSGDDEPRLVAVPHRRHRAHHCAPPRFVSGQAEENTDAEIEAVEQYVEQDADGQYGHPKHDHGYSPAATRRTGGARWCSSTTDIGRLGIAAAGGRIRRPAGPSRSSRWM